MAGFQLYYTGTNIPAGTTGTNEHGETLFPTGRTGVDADSLINSAIEARSQLEARLQNIDAQSHAIGQQLRNTNRRDRGRIAELQSQQRGLEQARTGIRAEQHSDDAMTNLRVQSQFRNAHLATKALEDQRHEDTARQTANIANGIARLEAKYPNRGFDAAQSDKFQAEAEQLGSQNEMGARSQAGRQALFQAAKFHDEVRQKTLANAASALSKLTQGGLTPEEFANRDHKKDFTTNATDLASAQSEDIKVSKRPKSGEPIGVNTVFNAGGANWMLPTQSFSHFDSNFKLQPTAQTAPVDQPMTPDQQAQEQGYRNLDQYNQFLKTGKVVAPTGTVGDSAVQARQAEIKNLTDTGRVVGGTPEQIDAARKIGAARQQYLEQNPDAMKVVGGAEHTYDNNVRVNFPANLEPNIPANRTATLPTGVQPNQPLQPVTQLGTQPMANAPQVAQQPAQPTATPAVQQAAAPSATPQAQTRVVGGVTYGWSTDKNRWEPQ